jgi:selenocysteine lyase/cysteine desulfurase
MKRLDLPRDLPILEDWLEENAGAVPCVAVHGPADQKRWRVGPFLVELDRHGGDRWAQQLRATLTFLEVVAACGTERRLVFAARPGIGASLVEAEPVEGGILVPFGPGVRLSLGLMEPGRGGYFLPEPLFGLGTVALM